MHNSTFRCSYLRHQLEGFITCVQCLIGKLTVDNLAPIQGADVWTYSLGKLLSVSPYKSTIHQVLTLRRSSIWECWFCRSRQALPHFKQSTFFFDEKGLLSVQTGSLSSLLAMWFSNHSDKLNTHFKSPLPAFFMPSEIRPQAWFFSVTCQLYVVQVLVTLMQN